MICKYNAFKTLSKTNLFFLASLLEFHSSYRDKNTEKHNLCVFLLFTQGLTLLIVEAFVHAP